MRKRWLLLAAICLNVEVLAQQPTTCDVSLTYLANEGVLIRSATAGIIIDGFHRFYRDAYSFLPDDEHQKLMQRQAPYDDIDLVLVSHIHRDHFDAASVAQYLTLTESVDLISSPQLVDSVRAAGTSGNTIAVDYSDVYEASFEEAGINLKVSALPHSSRRFAWIQNLGHLIEVEGRTILHVGDADINIRNFERSGLVDSHIDVAVVPFWFLTSVEGRQLVDEIIRPSHVIAAHISPGDAENVRRQVESHYPDATVFTKLTESRHVMQTNCPDQ